MSKTFEPLIRRRITELREQAALVVKVDWTSDDDFAQIFYFAESFWSLSLLRLSTLVPFRRAEMTGWGQKWQLPQKSDRPAILSRISDEILFEATGLEDRLEGRTPELWIENV